MASSTEVLRALLDEREVKWMPCAWEPQTETFYKNGDGVAFIAMESASQYGLLLRTDIAATPEQAIAATLGATDAKPTQAESSGTCKLDDFADVPFSVDYEIEGYDMDSGRDYATLAECSACGAYVIVPPEYHHVLTCDGDEVYQPYRFCPNCGRRIVDPTTNDVDAVVTNG